MLVVPEMGDLTIPVSPHTNQGNKHVLIDGGTGAKHTGRYRPRSCILPVVWGRSILTARLHGGAYFSTTL